MDRLIKICQINQTVNLWLRALVVVKAVARVLLWAEMCMMAHTTRFQALKVLAQLIKEKSWAAVNHQVIKQPRFK
jgi:hypothetical protein